MLHRRSVLLFGARFVLATVIASLAPLAVAAPDDEPYVLRTYEVGDLVLNVPDYPLETGSLSGGYNPRIGMGGIGMGGMGMGGMGGMGGGGGMGEVGSVGTMAMMSGGRGDSPMSASGVAAITMEDLVRAITTLVGPGTWARCGDSMGPAAGAEMGGMGPGMPGAGMGGPMGPVGVAAAPEPQARTQPRGEIQPLGATLLVRQSRAIHDEIGGLLAQLRQGSSRRRTVAVDARWLVLNSDDLDRLAPSDKQGRLQVDRDVLAEFTRRPTSIRGLTNCFSGQLVYLVGGTRRNVVSGYIPVVGSLERPLDRGSQPNSDTQFVSLRDGARVTYVREIETPQTLLRDPSVGYQPVIEKPNFGTLLEIRPTLIPGGDEAVVDLRSTITVPGVSTGAGESGPPGRLVPAIDRIAVETQQLATTLSVPLGRPVLVGGLTYVGPLPASESSSDKDSPPVRAGQGRGLAAKPGSDSSETPQLYLVLELR